MSGIDSSAVHAGDIGRAEASNRPARGDLPGCVFVVPWRLTDDGGVNRVVRGLYHQFESAGACTPRVLVTSWDHVRPITSYEDGHRVTYMRVRGPVLTVRPSWTGQMASVPRARSAAHRSLPALEPRQLREPALSVARRGAVRSRARPVRPCDEDRSVLSRPRPGQCDAQQGPGTQDVANADAGSGCHRVLLELSCGHVDGILEPSVRQRTRTIHMVSTSASRWRCGTSPRASILGWRDGDSPERRVLRAQEGPGYAPACVRVASASACGRRHARARGRRPRHGRNVARTRRPDRRVGPGRLLRQIAAFAPARLLRRGRALLPVLAQGAVRRRAARGRSVPLPVVATSVGGIPRSSNTAPTLDWSRRRIPMPLPSSLRNRSMIGRGPISWPTRCTGAYRDTSRARRRIAPT